MLELGILKTFDSGTHKAGVQLVGSLTTYLDDIAVATNIAAEAMITGNYLLVAIPGGNPRDACVVASWPQGSSGGGGGGSKIQDADADTSWDVEQAADEDKIHGKVAGVEAFLLDNDGILTLAKQSGCRVHLSAGQSIPSDIWTVAALDTVDFDIQSEFNTTTHRFVPKSAGLYFAVGMFAYQDTEVIADKLWSVSIKKNAVYIITSHAHSAVNQFLYSSCAEVIQLAVGDYLELRLYHTAGVNKTCFHGPYGVHLAVAKLA